MIYLVDSVMDGMRLDLYLQRLVKLQIEENPEAMFVQAPVKGGPCRLHFITAGAVQQV
jgi:hypothetical protein